MPAAGPLILPEHVPDRRSMLTMMGALGIVLGLGCAGMAALSLLGNITVQGPNQPQLPWTLHLWTPLFYLGMGLAFAWLGWGAMRARRWARDLWLMLAAPWFVAGLLGLIGVAVLVPGMLRGMMAGLPGSPGNALAMGVFEKILVSVLIGFVTLVYVVLPGGLWWFYSRPSVRATCLAADPRPSWTEACPLPVLGAALWLWFAALMMPPSALMYRGWFPLFGVVLPQALGVLAYLAIAAALVLAGWWLYRRRMAGWWLAVGSFGLLGASWWVSLRRLGFAPMFEAMGYPKEMMKLVNAMLPPETLGPMMGWGFVVWGVLPVAALLWIRPKVRRP